MYVANASAIIFILLLALFALSFITGKRFGILALALAAGTLLASQTVEPLEYMFQIFQQYLGGISPAQATTILLLLAPSIVLMFSSGQKHSSIKSRILSSLLYIVMAAFAILPFVMTQIQIPDEIKNIVMTSHSLALAIGVVLAVADCFLNRK